VQQTAQSYRIGRVCVCHLNGKRKRSLASFQDSAPV
jgi:hypothetical protein